MAFKIGDADSQKIKQQLFLPINHIQLPSVLHMDSLANLTTLTGLECSQNHN